MLQRFLEEAASPGRNVTESQPDPRARYKMNMFFSSLFNREFFLLHLPVRMWMYEQRTAMGKEMQRNHTKIYWGFSKILSFLMFVGMWQFSLNRGIAEIPSCFEDLIFSHKDDGDCPE